MFSTAPGPSDPASTAKVWRAFPDPRSAGFVDRFGIHLVAAGSLDELALQRAQRAARHSGERFDHVLTKLGLLPEADLVTALAAFLALPVMAAADVPVSAVLQDAVSEVFVRTNRLLPLAAFGSTLTLAVVDPFLADPLDALAYATGLALAPCLVAPTAFDALVATLYGSGPSSPRDLVVDSRGETASEGDLQRLRELANEAPVIRRVGQIVANAIDAGASDIHIEPGLDALTVRYRIDGALIVVETLPPGLKAAIASRIKIMARLDIAERRMPQDGRTRIAVRGTEIDFRVSTLPTVHGESLVLRILDRARVPLELTSLGFDPQMITRLRQLMRLPNGIVLVTGPTGSGKTTTLYTLLREISRPDVKVVTVEDPVEYQLAGINQVQVQPAIGLDFPHALRSILRQDPDVIMIGEIRDAETARIAIQAALTGHLVVSTLHTNSASATVTRLLDMGIESYLIAATVKAILAQRLVRRLCTVCAVPMDEPEPWLDVPALWAKGAPPAFRSPGGCAACRQTGYRGRTTIAELMVMDAALHRLVCTKAVDADVEAAARSAGMRSLALDGFAKARDGMTSVEDILAATQAL